MRKSTGDGELRGLHRFLFTSENVRLTTFRRNSGSSLGPDYGNLNIDTRGLNLGWSNIYYYLNFIKFPEDNQ